MRRATQQDMPEILDLFQRIHAAIDAQPPAERFEPQGGSYRFEPESLALSLVRDINNPNVAIFFTTHAIFWGEMERAIHDYSLVTARDKVYLTDWKSLTDGVKVLKAFCAWAETEGATHIYVGSQPPNDPRKEKFMRRYGFRPWETAYVKRVEEQGDVERIES